MPFGAASCFHRSPFPSLSWYHVFVWGFSVCSLKRSPVPTVTPDSSQEPASLVLISVFPPMLLSCLRILFGVGHDSRACLDLDLGLKAPSQAHSRWCPIAPPVPPLLQDGIPSSEPQSLRALLLCPCLSPAWRGWGGGGGSLRREVGTGSARPTSGQPLVTPSFHNWFTLRTRFYLNSCINELFLAYELWATARTRKIHLSSYLANANAAQIRLCILFC